MFMGTLSQLSRSNRDCTELAFGKFGCRPHRCKLADLYRAEAGTERLEAGTERQLVVDTEQLVAGKD